MDRRACRIAGSIIALAPTLWLAGIAPATCLNGVALSALEAWEFRQAGRSSLDGARGEVER